MSPTTDDQINNNNSTAATITNGTDYTNDTNATNDSSVGEPKPFHFKDPVQINPRMTDDGKIDSVETHWRKDAAECMEYVEQVRKLELIRQVVETAWKQLGCGSMGPEEAQTKLQNDLTERYNSNKVTDEQREIGGRFPPKVDLPVFFSDLYKRSASL